MDQCPLVWGAVGRAGAVEWRVGEAKGLVVLRDTSAGSRECLAAADGVAASQDFADQCRNRIMKIGPPILTGIV